jgi:hypothetical protein
MEAGSDQHNRLRLVIRRIHAGDIDHAAMTANCTIFSPTRALFQIDGGVICMPQFNVGAKMKNHYCKASK